MPTVNKNIKRANLLTDVFRVQGVNPPLPSKSDGDYAILLSKISISCVEKGKGWNALFLPLLSTAVLDLFFSV